MMLSNYQRDLALTYWVGEKTFSCSACGPRAYTSTVGHPCCPPTLTGRKCIAVTHKPGSPQPPDQGGRDHSRPPRWPRSSKWDTPSSHTPFKPTWGRPFGGASARGWFGHPGCFARCSSRHRESLQPARSLHLTRFLFFTQLPADNKLSIRSPQEHLQLSSLSRTSAWPRTNSSILNCSQMSHLQLFYCPNCPDLRGTSGNWISSHFSNKSTSVAKHRSKRTGLLQVWGKSNQEWKNCPSNYCSILCKE